MSDRINSKNKGSRNERYATQALEEWTSMPFTRVPQSGGLRWQGGQNITGDIIPEDMYELEAFPFSVEVKVRKELAFEDLLLPNNSDILKFWAQSTADAARVNKIPMVMMRRDRMPKNSFYILFPLSTYIRIRKYLYLHKYLRYAKEFIICYSDEFFKADYDKVADVLTKYK